MRSALLQYSNTPIPQAIGNGKFHCQSFDSPAPWRNNMVVGMIFWHNLEKGPESHYSNRLRVHSPLGRRLFMRAHRNTLKF